MTMRIALQKECYFCNDKDKQLTAANKEIARLKDENSVYRTEWITQQEVIEYERAEIARLTKLNDAFHKSMDDEMGTTLYKASERMRIKAEYETIPALKAQLATANHTIERLVSEAANTPELLRQLSVAREALEWIVENRTIVNLNYVGIAKQALTKMEG
jgi:hypothetical protein